MKINGIEIDSSQLLSKQELMDILRENGESDRALSYVRERNFEIFNNEMIWRYPISDGCHIGTFIVPVKEGIISLPYDIIERQDYEILELQDASMFDAQAADDFIQDWECFSDDLLYALRGIREHLKSSASQLIKQKGADSQ